jgi:hypothetical protein
MTMNYFPLTFSKNGSLSRPEELDILTGRLRKLDPPALLLFAHGWLTTRPGAEFVYDKLAIDLDPFVVAGIHWPSKAFNNVQGLISVSADLASYYDMKERAAAVGAGGLAPALHRIHLALPRLKIHLAGHSFGARLVTAAAAASAVPPIASLTLVQAAFSQFAFTPEGAFRKVVSPRRITGPICVTHSENDQILGDAYPVASLLKHQNSSGLGGPDDPYGALGHNGACHLPPDEAIGLNLGDLESLRLFLHSPVVNLNATGIIKAHTSWYRPEMIATLRTLVETL